MAGKSDTFELELLKLVFQAVNPTTLSGLMINQTAGPLTNLYVSLHTADPHAGSNPEAGLQTASEATYTGYNRVTVARTTGGWTVAAASGVTTAKPVAAITFPACTAGSNTITHFSVGVAAHPTAGAILYSGAVSPSITVTNGITPQLTTATSISED